MKLYNNDKDKRIFQSFVNFKKKIRTSLVIKKHYSIFLLTFIMYKHVKVEKDIEYMRQKLSKNMLIVKFHSALKCLHLFFFLFLSLYEI